MSKNKAFMTYLCISDSNTKGMEYTPGDTNSPFYSFVKCAGNSVKNSTESGGSFGFGKAAYFNVSKVRALLVSTQTTDGKDFFEGVASLCTHKLNNEGNYQPVGFYCDNKAEEPISRRYAIPEIFRRNEPGTSVAIMGIDYEDMGKGEIITEIASSVILNFWCAILHKRLIVRIDNSIELNASNIVELAKKYYPDSDEDPKYARTRNPRPYIDAVANAETDAKHIRCKKKLDILGTCSLYVLKKKTGTDNILYMRSPRMLVFNDKSRTNYGFYGVFICHNQQGNELLRQIEDPSHSEWDWKRITDSKALRMRAKDAMTEMRNFIQESLSSIFVSANVDHVDIKGLEDYLYIPTEYDPTNDESEKSADVGVPTGIFLDEGTSHTTDIVTPPVISDISKDTNSAGEIIIKTSKNAKPDPEGGLLSGHGTKPRKGTKAGVPMPGDQKEHNSPDDEGSRGYFATEIIVPYRTFSQVESGVIVHYVVFRSPSLVDRFQIRFFSIGEEGEEPLKLRESDMGTTEGNLLKDCFLMAGANRIRVRFDDNLKHSIKLITEELVQL
jgi:hypothetical protein